MFLSSGMVSLVRASLEVLVEYNECPVKLSKEVGELLASSLQELLH
jgi:hypothetical protein